MPIQLHQMKTMLATGDMDATIAFYHDVLGFTLGDKFESATEGVAQREDGKPPLALHSMYLEFTFTTPSGDADNRRRYLLAPRTDYEDDNAALWQLITDHTYSVAAGDMPVDFLADRYVGLSIEALDWLEFTVRKTFRPDVKIPVPAELSADVPPLAQLWSMRRRPVDDEEIVRFHAVPGLVGIRNGYKDAQTAFMAVDVVYNRLEHVRITESGLSIDRGAALRNGVWDTVLESVPARLRQPELASSASTIGLFDLARDQGIATTVLKGSGELERLDVDENARQFLRDDLERGYTIVTTERVPDGAPMAAWWRIQPDSGETLGMTGDGYGQDSVEYVIIDLIKTGQGLVNGVNAIRQCELEPSMPTRLCCLVNAHANNVMGESFGSIMGELLTTNTKLFWDAVSSGYESATGNSLMPSVGPMDCSAVPDTEW
jgi:catechol 2,3-dioxygenase-like lactoylglutathione lyase family enzyme